MRSTAHHVGRGAAAALLSLGLLGLLLSGPLSGQAPTPSPGEKAGAVLPADWVKAMTWRCIGPANMGGRITAISAYEADPNTYWVASAGGGLLKTTNNGTTF